MYLLRKITISAIAAASLIAFAGCSDKDNKSDSSAKDDVKAEGDRTLAEKLTDNIQSGKYAIDMVISGGSYGEETPYKIISNGDDALVTTRYGGIHTEFYTIDDKTYMLIPDICFYEETDALSGSLDGLFIIGEGDSLLSEETSDGVTTEVYTSSADGEGKDTYTYEFDADTGELKSLKAENGSEDISIVINSISWNGTEIKMPDLTGWCDMSDSEKLSETDQLKLSLYCMGIDEQMLTDAGYTYEQLAEMSDEELAETLGELGVNIFG